MNASAPPTRHRPSPVHPPLDPGVVLAGVTRAGARGRWAPMIDVTLVAAVLVAGLQVAPAVGLLAGAAVLAGSLVALARQGQTLGQRILQVRSVDPATGLPPTPATWRARGSLTADLRTGRDPLSACPSGTPRTSPGGHDPWVPAGSAQDDRPLLVLVVDDGTVLPVTGRAVVGRRPADPSGTHQLVALTDLSRTVSRNHVLLEPVGDQVWVADLGSANGTRLAPPGQGFAIVPAGTRVAAGWGWRLALGDRALTLTDPATVEAP